MTGCADTVPSGAVAARGGSAGAAATQSGAGGQLGGAGLGSGGAGAGAGVAARRNSSDRVMLGMTGIQISRLAMGSGTHGSDGSSDQTRLGSQFSNILTYGYSQGLTVFETADAYGAHKLVADAIRQVGRHNVTVLTKTAAVTAAGVEADLARFRQEMGVDMIDIVLLHNKQSATWTTECEGAMEALSRAKQSGSIELTGYRVYPCSPRACGCDAVGRRRSRAHQPCRGSDGRRSATVIAVLERMKAAAKASSA